MKPRRMRSMPASAYTTTAAPSVIEEVSRAMSTGAQGSARKLRGWSRTHATPALRAMAGIFGVYLAYSVLRLQELYPVLAVPRLPMILSILILLVVVASTPGEAWKQIWQSVPAVQMQAALVVLGTINAPFGIWMGGALNFLVFKYSLSVIVFISAVVLLRDRRAMATALSILLLAGVAVGLYTLSDSAQTFGSSTRVSLGITLDPNDLAQILVALIPLALYMGQRKGGRSFPWFAAAAVLTLAIVPTESRGGILGIGAVALTLISFGTSPWKKAFNMAVVTAGAVAISMAAGSDSRMTDFSDYEGGEGRVAIWKRGLVWMTWRPWGYGLDNFPLYFGWLNGPERSAHNSFVQIGVELGVLGLAAFSGMIYTLARELLKQRRQSIALRGRVEGAEAEAVLATMVLASMAGTFVSGFFLSKAYASITLFVLGLAAATVLGYPFRSIEAGNPAPVPPSNGRHPRLPANR